jgi:hypothetical protein
MIDGPVAEMIERNKTRDNFKLPPWIADIRPQGLKTGGAVAILTCADPRIDPREIFVLDAAPGRLSHFEPALEGAEAN